METATYRETKYCNSIRDIIKRLGHVTNVELLHHLQRDFPELSATTVHRVTARLASRDEIGLAPNTHRGAVRYDAQVKPHDHFSCNACDRLCDTDIKDKIQPIIEGAIADCAIPGNIVITGLCNLCNSK
ncbi:MAG: transcriptional repressor [Candidatus Saccharimonadales bacterium]